MIKKFLNYLKTWIKVDRLSFVLQFIPLVMTMSPFFYGYFGEDYKMAKDEKIGFTIYFILVGGALILSWYRGYITVKRYRRENG